MISITLISKSGGPLSKRIWLDAHVQVQSDGSTCVMARAEAVRLELRSADDLAFVSTRLNLIKLWFWARCATGSGTRSRSSPKPRSIAHRGRA